MSGRPPELNGFLNVDKPAGITSRDVVDRVCRVVGTNRVGHAGTLDPLAVGVLVVAVGKATRLVEYVQAQQKTYRAGFLLGRTSDTDDIEGVVSIRDDVSPPDLAAVEAALKRFRGTVLQRPPAYSAIKLQGRRAYDLARSGAEVDLPPRPVQIDRLDIESYGFPCLRLEIDCRSGTYIRSIARDLGETLGVGGLMETLERTAVGVFRRGEAVSLEALEQTDWRTCLRPLLDGCAGLPVVELKEEQRGHFDAGRAFRIGPATTQGREVAVTCDGAFVGVGSFDPSSGTLRPSKGGFLAG